MTDLTLNNFTTDRKYDGIFFKKIVETAVKELDLETKKLELSVNLVGEGRIKALNKKYRERNRITDVLSFPLQNKISAKSASNGIMSLGDIFICLPVAKKHAEREGATLDYKLAFLIVHGFLHLLGYDHEKSSKEKNKMFALQDKILKQVIADS